MPREILEADFKDLIVKVSDNEPIEITAVAAADVAKVGGKTKEEAHDFDLALTSDNTEYKVDDRAGLYHQVDGGLQPHAGQCRCKRGR